MLPDFDLVEGDDYLEADDCSLLLTPSAPWPDLTGASAVTLKFRGRVSRAYALILSAPVEVLDSFCLVSVDLTATQTVILYSTTGPDPREVVTLDYQLTAVLASGHTALLERGTCAILPRIPEASAGTPDTIVDENGNTFVDENGNTFVTF